MLFPGVTPFEILFSHVITQFVVMCGQTALVLIFMIIVFGVECKGNVLSAVILTILQGLCGMCFGEYALILYTYVNCSKYFFCIGIHGFSAMISNCASILGCSLLQYNSAHKFAIFTVRLSVFTLKHQLILIHI